MIRIPLDRIRDNPFQTRQTYEITELANSILAMAEARPESSGLLQVPVGRIVLPDGGVLDPKEYGGGVMPCLGDEPEAVVQLAAGHRRLRAFERLADVEGEEYETLPVDIQVLTDQQMADIAWTENQEREDLTPIEEARALQQAMESFDWTQAQVGERWGLSQSAVANLLRLLKLPDDARAAIQSGAITARHGRVLLTALGKSPRIYARAALEILPLPVEEGVAAKAREIVGDRRVWNTSLSRITDLDIQRCAACGGPVGHPDSDKVPTFYDDNQRDVYLCLACARAGEGWQPRSVAWAEDKVKRVIDMWSPPLKGDFPVNQEIGAGDPLVHQGKCTECQYQKGAVCFDKACYLVKKEHWREIRALKFQAAVRRKWPEDSLPPVIYDYSGHDLSGYSDTDKGMVESGWCSPACDHLRFRHSPREKIRPVKKYPFIFNCDNTSRCKACRRRYLKSLETDEAQAEAKAIEQAAAERKKIAKAFLARAEASVAHALLQEHEGAWRELALQMGAEAKAGQSLAVSVPQVAEAMLQGVAMEWLDWRVERTEERFESHIREELARLGVGLAPGMEELAERLARMRAFLLGEDGLPRADLTSEQIAGNAANLERLAADIEAIPSAQDRARLWEEMEDLQALFPGKSSEDEKALGEWIRAPVAVEYEVEA